MIEHINKTTVDGTQSESLKSLSEYFDLAEVPTYDGIGQRVVNAITTRLDSGNLDMQTIADDLQLTGRTLQRHLQFEKLTFQGLREKVRFYFAIRMLMLEEKSIKDICKELSFSDRTSFAVAYKRWTGLSPDVFRRVYRDQIGTIRAMSEISG